MDHRVYINILHNYLKLSAQKLGILNNYQDNKHPAMNVCLFCLYHCSQTLKTPAQSPDLIPIFGKELEVRIRSHNIKSKINWQQYLMIQERNKIGGKVTDCDCLVRSMDRHLKAVKKNKGYPTRYWKFIKV